MNVIVPKVKKLGIVLCALVHDCVCGVVRVKHLVKAVIGKPLVGPGVQSIRMLLPKLLVTTEIGGSGLNAHRMSTLAE